MVEVEIDGRKVEVPEGSMVMHAAHKLDIYVPHFCYHKKLSIAANCRMCLVDVEKAPKPLPACATPVTNGMKVLTHSDKAIKAQKGVMEFLLINHPLDCPICDQGGECQLQDLAVGYGASGSRYTEAKRVVFQKNLGPLVSAAEMARCIQCTRCVRFGQEVAGIMELGMAGRGEHSEIMSFVGRSVDSELSGNMIDLCPVGALTSKPFRYSARTWELVRRRSVAPHDSLASPLVVQVKQNKVMRVLPFEDESLNEGWLSDRDRFSYEGLNSPERLLKPMLKHDGAWHEVEWQTALEYVAKSLNGIKADHGAASIGALASPTSTLEELSLLGALVRGLGSDNIDTRVRQADFGLDGRTAGVPWLGMKVADVSELEQLLLVGSFLRKDHPVLAARIRQAVKRGCRVSVLHAADDDLLMPLAAKAIVSPGRWAGVLASVLVAASQAKGVSVPAELADVSVDDTARAMATGLLSGERKAILLGNAALQQADASRLVSLAVQLAALTGATVGYLGDAANNVGAALAGALPGAGGLNARQMIEQPLRAYLLLNLEPSLDSGFPALATAALGQAATVIALTAFRSAELLAQADCLLPIAPFTETSGTFVNAEGRAQSFNGVVKPAGDARPAWKVLRVLGNLLGLAGFEQDNSEQVRDAVLAGDWSSRLSNALTSTVPLVPGVRFDTDNSLERIADVPLYASDMLVRRADSLQQTRDAAPPQARVNTATAASLALTEGDQVRVSQPGAADVVVSLRVDDTVADGTLRLAAAVPQTAGLAAIAGPVSVAKA